MDIRDIFAEYGDKYYDLPDGYIFMHADVESSDEDAYRYYSPTLQRFGDEADKAIWELRHEIFVPVDAIGEIYGETGVFIKVG